MNQTTKFRPVAIPLVTSDPFFSLWSFTDQLTDDHTRHWTGMLQSMFGFINIDGEKFRFMGKAAVTDRYFPEGKELSDGTCLAHPMWAFNPGSLGEPRGGKPSYGLLQIRNGQMLFSHGTL